MMNDFCRPWWLLHLTSLSSWTHTRADCVTFRRRFLCGRPQHLASTKALPVRSPPPFLMATEDTKIIRCPLYHFIIAAFFYRPHLHHLTLAPNSSCARKVGFLFSFSGWGETQSTWYVGHCWPIVPAPDDRWRLWAVGGMRIGRGNRNTRRKPAPVPLCPQQISHDLTWDRTRTAAVGSPRLARKVNLVL
jgi:hypothetical protein